MLHRWSVMAMALLGVVAAVSVVWSARLVRASAADPEEGPATLAAVSWMSGAWHGSSDQQGRVDEFWTKPAAGAMSGTFRWVKGEKPIVYELLLLEEDAEGVAMRLRHFGPAMRAWEDAPLLLRLVEHGEGRAVFETPEPVDGQHTHIGYVLDGGTLKATVTTRKEGSPERSFILAMERAL